MFSAYLRGYEEWLSPDKWHIRNINLAANRAKVRSLAKDVPYNIDGEYLLSIYPQDGKCPVFGIDMVWGSADGQENSPTVDRIHPALGYTKGNVIWVSGYANRLKQDHSLDTLRTLLAFYEKLERRNE